MSQLAGAAFIATATIQPFTAVSISGNFSVAPAVSNDPLLIGISQPGTDFAPGVPAGASQQAALVNETLQIYGPGDVCLFKVTAAVTAGQWLKPDGSAQGVVAVAGSTQYVIAKTLEAANAGEFCRVVVTLICLT